MNSPSPKLDNIPDLALREVLNNLNVNDQKALLCTSRTLIQIIKPLNQKLYNKIHLRTSWNWADILTTHQSGRYQFTTTESGYPEDPEEARIVMISKVIAELNNIIKPNTKFKNLFMKTEGEEMSSRLYDAITDIAKGKSVMHVEKLTLVSYNPLKYWQLLSVITPGVLHTIEIDIKTEEINQQESRKALLVHLPNLKKLRLKIFPPSLTIMDVIHVPEVEIDVNDITPETMTKYKEMISKNPHFKYHSFECRIINKETIMTALMPYEETPVDNDRRRTYCFKCSDEGKINFKFRAGLEFKKM